MGCCAIARLDGFSPEVQQGSHSAANSFHPLSPLHPVHHQLNHPTSPFFRSFFHFMFCKSPIYLSMHCLLIFVISLHVLIIPAFLVPFSYSSLSFCLSLLIYLSGMRSRLDDIGFISVRYSLSASTNYISAV